MEDLKKKYFEISEKTVKSRLVFEAIIKEEKMEKAGVEKLLEFLKENNTYID
jgi:hypothetical protein